MIVFDLATVGYFQLVMVILMVETAVKSVDTVFKWTPATVLTEAV